MHVFVVIVSEVVEKFTIAFNHLHSDAETIVFVAHLFVDSR